MCTGDRMAICRTVSICSSVRRLVLAFTRQPRPSAAAPRSSSTIRSTFPPRGPPPGGPGRWGLPGGAPPPPVPATRRLPRLHPPAVCGFHIRVFVVPRAVQGRRPRHHVYGVPIHPPLRAFGGWSDEDARV